MNIAAVVPVVIAANAGAGSTLSRGQAFGGHDGNEHRNNHVSLEAQSPFLYALSTA